MVIYIILGCIILGLIITIILLATKKSKVNKTQLKLLSQEEQLSQNRINTLKLNINQLEDKNKELHSILSELQNEIGQKQERNNTLTIQEQEVQQKILQLQNTANSIYDNALQTAQDKFDIQIEELSQYYQKQEEIYKQQYLQTLEDWTAEYNSKKEEDYNNLQYLSTILSTMRSNIQAAIEDEKRKKSEEMEQKFYQLQISDLDLKEVDKIRDILHYMRNERPLCKAIWESYYRTPCNDLVARIIDKKQGQTGVYKITNQLDSKIYIGQAVNLTDRIKSHVKAGLGIDTPNSNLYKAMRQDGVENFSFEILEYCTQKELNDKEKFWIDYYDSKDWGYNMTIGGSAAR